MEGKRLDVFCVSNKWYEQYCPKGNNEFVEASGVPELRRFYHALTAEAQLNEAKHFLKSKLELLNDSIYNELNAVEDGAGCVTISASFLQELSVCFQEQIMTFFARRDQHWEEAASKEGQKWTESKLEPIPYHTEDATNDCVAAQYNAWRRNNDNRQTMKRGQENWNARIIWKMRMELEGQWDLVEEEVSDDFLAMLRGAKSLLETWNATLPQCVPSQYATSLAHGVDFQIQNLDYRIKREEQVFLGEGNTPSIDLRLTKKVCFINLLHPKLHFLSSDQSLGLWPSGGQTARQISIVPGHIEERVVFPQLSIAIAESMNKGIAAAGKKVDDLFEDVVGSIKKDVDTIFRSHPRLQTRPTLRNEQRESKIRDFADEIKHLKQKHERLLQSIESL
ncbi:hypothetical protein NM208_g1316 [Fusarium decemcellulare]|uniref:Uncharacterized protein n=1 Tax=Fusarium decemcellulare TaxID=57161 RepID=A0ACC1SWI9_9HYPO|nr:hypothetical protein NM208_g1316 [Fusarium decemcellulare]